MIRIIIIISIFLTISCCDIDDCEPINVVAFTHYQINEGTMNISEFANGLKVYDKPNGNVIFNLLPDEEAGWAVVLLKKEAGYFKIENTWSQAYVQSQGGSWAKIWKHNWMSGYKYVWINVGSVGLNTQNYDGQIINLFNKPNKESHIVGQLNKVQTVKVLDACGQWALIEGVSMDKKIIKGWLSKEWQCGNPNSPCS